MEQHLEHDGQRRERLGHQRQRRVHRPPVEPQPDNPSLGGAYYFSPMEGWKPTAGFYGDLGMLTANGHRKAVANVFEMYSKLGPERLGGFLVGLPIAACTASRRATPRTTASRW